MNHSKASFTKYHSKTIKSMQKLYTSEMMQNLCLSSVPSGGQMIEIQKYLSLGPYECFISKAQQLECPKLFIMLLNHKINAYKVYQLEGINYAGYFFATNTLISENSFNLQE